MRTFHFLYFSPYHTHCKHFFLQFSLLQCILPATNLESQSHSASKPIYARKCMLNLISNLPLLLSLLPKNKIFSCSCRSSPFTDFSFTFLSDAFFTCNWNNFFNLPCCHCIENIYSLPFALKTQVTQRPVLPLPAPSLVLSLLLSCSLATLAFSEPAHAHSVVIHSPIWQTQPIILKLKSCYLTPIIQVTPTPFYSQTILL